MSNLKSLTNLYPTLTPEERLSAMIAARAREDKTELDKLASTAPKANTYRVYDFFGLSEAFDWLALWHVMFQLGLIGNLHFLLCYEEALKPVKVTIRNHKSEGIEETETDLNAALGLTIQRILEGREAWLAICSEYNIDPAAALKSMPYLEFIEYSEMVAIKSAAELGIELTDRESNIEVYREVIRTKRAEWE